MNATDHSPLPLEQWSEDMRAAVTEICELGARLLRTHRAASERSSQVAEQWKLGERLTDERVALEHAFDGLRGILSAIDETWQLMRRRDVEEAQLRQSMRDCAAVIDDALPALQQDFLTIRHCALDLLRWVRRFAEVEGSALPAEYRASYARLLSYTPVFRPRLESMQSELLLQSRDTQVSPDVQKMLTALNQYVVAVESARAFVKSVVEPPMELVFHDAESFQNDWRRLAPQLQGRLGTELNDCCQFLLYDPAGFHSLVDNIQRPLSEGIDASLFVLPVDTLRIVFTMDEDPVFQQLIVTLLRVVSANELEETVDSVVRALQKDFSSD